MANRSSATASYSRPGWLLTALTSLTLTALMSGTPPTFAQPSGRRGGRRYGRKRSG